MWFHRVVMPTYLQRRDNRWHAILEIPLDLRAHFGKRRFVQSLGTESLVEAKRLVGRVISDWLDQLQRARGGPTAPVDAQAWRDALKRASGTGEARDEYGRPTDDRTLVLDLIYDRASEIDYGGDRKAAETFYSEATAIDTASYVDDWLATADIAPKGKVAARNDVTRFALAFPTLASVQRQPVRAWVTMLMRERGLSPKTVQRSCSALRGYWRYLEHRGVVDAERAPFDKLDVARRAARSGDVVKRRAFTPEDVVRLRDASEGRLRALIELAMFTGCRIAELCSLQVSDVDLSIGGITIREAKTDAGVRVIPIHGSLMPLVVRLIDGRATGWLLVGLAANRHGDRSNAIGKRFGRLKTSLGYGPEVVFHSIRKTVATMLEQSGVVEGIAADILGHAKRTMSYGLYSSGTSMAQKREAIERLVYP